MLARRHRTFTSKEYLEIEARADYRSEFSNGEIFAMAGASLRHNIIIANIIGSLTSALRLTDCQAVSSDQRVKTANASFYTYPDIVIFCGNANLDKYETLENPQIIIEVLSDSTEEYDRGFKKEEYINIPSLQEYILVSQKEPKCEIFLRQDKGFVPGSPVNDFLPITTLGIQIPFSEVYRKALP